MHSLLVGSQRACSKLCLGISKMCSVESYSWPRSPSMDRPKDSSASGSTFVCVSLPCCVSNMLPVEVGTIARDGSRSDVPNDATTLFPVILANASRFASSCTDLANLGGLQMCTCLLKPRTPSFWFILSGKSLSLQCSAKIAIPSHVLFTAVLRPLLNCAFCVALMHEPLARVLLAFFDHSLRCRVFTVRR